MIAIGFVVQIGLQGGGDNSGRRAVHTTDFIAGGVVTQIESVQLGRKRATIKIERQQISVSPRAICGSESVTLIG